MSSPPVPLKEMKDLRSSTFYALFRYLAGLIENVPVLLSGGFVGPLCALGWPRPIVLKQCRGSLFTGPQHLGARPRRTVLPSVHVPCFSAGQFCEKTHKKPSLVLLSLKNLLPPSKSNQRPYQVMCA